jgi:hypothetical protein
VQSRPALWLLELDPLLPLVVVVLLDDGAVGLDEPPQLAVAAARVAIMRNRAIEIPDAATCASSRRKCPVAPRPAER